MIEIVLAETSEIRKFFRDCGLFAAESSAPLKSAAAYSPCAYLRASSMKAGKIGGTIFQDFVIPRDGGVAREIVDVRAVVTGGKGDGGKIENGGDQDDAVEMNAVVLLQIIAERGGAEGAVAFADQEFRRVPAIVAAEIGDDELREGFDVFVDTVEVFFGGFADRVAVAGAHGVDEDEVGFVEEAFAVVDEFVGSGRSEGAVDGPGAARAEGAHVQPHGGGAGAAVVEERDGARGEIFHVAARVGDGVEQAGCIALVVLEERGAGGGFVRNRLAADFYGVIGYRRFFFGCGCVALVRRFCLWRVSFAFGRLRGQARRLSRAQEKHRGKNPETLFHCVVPHLLNWIVLHPLNPAGLYVAGAVESKDRESRAKRSRESTGSKSKG